MMTRATSGTDTLDGDPDAFYGDVQNVQRGMVPRIYGHSYAIDTELYVLDGGAER